MQPVRQKKSEFFWEALRKAMQCQAAASMEHGSVLVRPADCQLFCHLPCCQRIYRVKKNAMAPCYCCTRCYLAWQNLAKAAGPGPFDPVDRQCCGCDVTSVTLLKRYCQGCRLPLVVAPIPGEHHAYDAPRQTTHGNAQRHACSDKRIQVGAFSSQ